MTKGEKMYVRLTKGLNDVGRLIPIDKPISNYTKDLNQDYYTSVYYYNEDQYKQFKKKRSVSGIRDVVTNKLIFDFDSPKAEDARKDAITLVDRLLANSIPEDSIGIYFSGKKGFHVELDTEHTFTPKQAKTVAQKLSEGLKTWDSVVYNSNRILRVPATRHPETGLFKTQLSLHELKNEPLEEIKSISSEGYESNGIKKTKLPIKLLELKNSIQEKPELKIVESNITMELDLSKKPKFLSPWKYALSMGFFPNGQRSNCLDILARTYRQLGFDKTQTYYNLKAAAELQANRYANGEKFSKDEIYNNIIEQVYADHFQGGTYSEDNFPEPVKDFLIELGIPRREDASAEESITSIDAGLSMFDHYANNIDKNTLKFGLKQLDDILKVQLGQLHGVLAPPGVGKSSMAFTLLKNTSKMGTKSFFASYDMYGSLVFQKLIMRELGISDSEIFQAYRDGDTDTINKFHSILRKNYQNVGFCFKSGQSIQELKNSIEYHEKSMGEKVKLVVVDYLELIRTKSADPTQSTMEAIQGLREIANDGDKVVVALLQPNKANSIVDEPILNYNAAKGSGAIAAAVTSMITMHRPGMSSTEPEYDKWLSMNIVKNRLGRLGQVDFNWDGPTGKITEMEDIELQELNEFRALKRSKKEEKDDF